MTFFFLPVLSVFSQVTAASHKQPFLDALSGSLVKMGPAGQLVDASADELKGKKYLFIYFSAHWCPPCRIFTPKLVDFYKKNKGNGDFELIFVSFDRDEKALVNYMKEEGMPWIAVKWRAAATEVLLKYAGRGIPSLALLDGEGRVLANSEVNGQYLGPDTAIKKYLELRQQK